MPKSLQGAGRHHSSPGIVEGSGEDEELFAG